MATRNGEFVRLGLRHHPEVKHYSTARTLVWATVTGLFGPTSRFAGAGFLQPTYEAGADLKVPSCTKTPEPPGEFHGPSWLRLCPTPEPPPAQLDAMNQIAHRSGRNSSLKWAIWLFPSAVP
jgi:hypothetical protein